MLGRLSVGWHLPTASPAVVPAPGAGAPLRPDGSAKELYGAAFVKVGGDA